ncbi:hypothetical protein HUW46_05371 [Amycolatopsis sp. CA-230715]|nr:hypothetical protein HUW46_05371 [Amycolatopsis sp. CA-230715]
MNPSAETVHALMAAYLKHTDKYGHLPVSLVRVNAGDDISERHLLVRAGYGPLSEVARALSPWAMTLDDRSVYLWDSGDMPEAQIQVHGALITGTPIEVVGYVIFGTGVFPNLKPGELCEIPVCALLCWAATALDDDKAETAPQLCGNPGLCDHSFSKPGPDRM